MKKTCIAYFCFLIPIIAFSQQGRTISAKSAVKQITYKKQILENKPVNYPLLQIKNFSLNDENRNSIIDSGEKAFFSFKVKNYGSKEAEGVITKLSIINSFVGDQEYISIDTIGTILPDEEIEMSIGLTGLSDLKFSPTRFKIDAVEKNGYNASPFIVDIKIAGKFEFKDPNKDSKKLDAVKKEQKDPELSPVNPPSNIYIPDKK
jgi:hypothetical protein